MPCISSSTPQMKEILEKYYHIDTMEAEARKCLVNGDLTTRNWDFMEYSWGYKGTCTITITNWDLMCDIYIYVYLIFKSWGYNGIYDI
jgi:hypothetical protein